jgi:hypothetical protein
MEIGLLIRYGRLVPGREAQAIDLFRETRMYFEEKVREGRLTSFEPFFLDTSDLEEELGFFVVKGHAPDVFQLMDDERFRLLVHKGMLLIEHLRVDMLTVGEGIEQQLERSLKANAELGI